MIIPIKTLCKSRYNSPKNNLFNERLAFVMKCGENGSPVKPCVWAKAQRKKPYFLKYP